MCAHLLESATPERRHNFVGTAMRWRPFDVGTAGACVHTCWSRPSKVVPRAAVDTSRQRYTSLAKAGQGWPGLAKAGQGAEHFPPTLHSRITNAKLAEKLYPVRPLAFLTNATLTYHQRYTLGSILSLPIVTTFLCLLYTSPSPRDGLLSRMPSSA